MIDKTDSPLPKAIRTDEKRWRQVLFNLVSNAVKFTEKSCITLIVGYHEGKLRFQVKNTGIGIAPEQLEERFLPFQQVGDLRGIVEQAARLEALDRQWVPFATHLRQLAKGFKGKQLLEFLKNSKRQNEY